MSEEINDPGSTQSVDQMSIARELNGVLEQVSIRLERIQQLTRSQADFINSMTQSFSQMQEYMTSMSENSVNMQGALEEAHEAALETFNENRIEKINDGLEKIADTYEEASNSQRENLEKINDSVIDMSRGTQAMNNSLAKSSNVINKSLAGGTQALGNFYKNSVNINSETQQLAEGMSELNDSIQDLTSGYGQMVKNVISSGFSIVKSIASFAFSLIGAAAKFAKFAATVPFTITKHAVNIGNTLRRDIVEVIQSAQEALKEKFDMDSEIGKGIQAMTSRGKGMLLSFQRPSSELVKLFGFGASGIANMIGFLGENLEAMGHFSEVFGKSLGQDMPKFKMFTKMVKAFGFSSEDVAYMSLDAATNMKDLGIRMMEYGVTLSSVSKEYGVDRKRLSKNVMILRRDITQFGHLSDEELQRTTARLTQMKVKLEDAAAVFKKFSTFEDAANSVAMLSQTFGMNLDAMDMIKATNPEEIIDMFRNSMLETGKSFQDLNRFEKDLMAQHTGMSAESLSALMNYRDLGLTHQESVRRMEAQKPAARQMAALKKLNSSIKEVQKVMTFDSPFKAFFKGLSNNVALSRDLRSTLTSLSSGYQGIYEYATKLDPNTWSGLIKPIKLIVDIMSNILRSDAFKGGLVKTVSSVADFVAEMFGATSGEIMLNKLKTNVSIAMQKGELKTQKDKDSFNKLVMNSVNNTKIGFMNLDKLNKIKDPSKLLTKLESYRSKLNETNQIKFDAMMKVIVSRVNKTYTKKQKQSGKKSETLLKTSSKEKDKLLAEGLLDVVEGNTNNLAKLLKLSGKIAGAVLKGAVVGASALMRVIAKGMDDFEAAQSKIKGPKKNMIEEFLHFEPGEFSKLAGTLSSAITGFIFNMQNAKNATSIIGWMLGGIKDLFSLAIGFFVDTLKGGINKLLGKEIFDTKTNESVMRGSSIKGIKSTDGSFALGALKNISDAQQAGDDYQREDVSDLISALSKKGGSIKDAKTRKILLDKVKQYEDDFLKGGKDPEVLRNLTENALADLGKISGGEYLGDVNKRLKKSDYETVEVSKVTGFDPTTNLPVTTKTSKIPGYINSGVFFDMLMKKHFLNLNDPNKASKYMPLIEDKFMGDDNFRNNIYSMNIMTYWKNYHKEILNAVRSASKQGLNTLVDETKNANKNFFKNVNYRLFESAIINPGKASSEGDRGLVGKEMTSIDGSNEKVQTKDFASDMFNKIMSNMPNLGSGIDLISNMLDSVRAPNISDSSLFETFNIADYNPLNMFSSNTTIPKATEKKVTKEEMEAVKKIILGAKKDLEEKNIEVEGNMILNETHIELLGAALVKKNLVGMMTHPRLTQGVKALKGTAIKDATGNEGAYNDSHSPGYSAGN